MKKRPYSYTLKPAHNDYFIVKRNGVTEYDTRSVFPC